jgi:hypothetical protein
MLIKCEYTYYFILNNSIRKIFEFYVILVMRSLESEGVLINLNFSQFANIAHLERNKKDVLLYILTLCKLKKYLICTAK